MAYIFFTKKNALENTGHYSTEGEDPFSDNSPSVAQKPSLFRNILSGIGTLCQIMPQRSDYGYAHQSINQDAAKISNDVHRIVRIHKLRTYPVNVNFLDSVKPEKISFDIITSSQRRYKVSIKSNGTVEVREAKTGKILNRKVFDRSII